MLSETSGDLAEAEQLANTPIATSRQKARSNFIVFIFSFERILD